MGQGRPRKGRARGSDPAMRPPDHPHRHRDPELGGLEKFLDLELLTTR